MKYPKGVDGALDRVFSALVRERSGYNCEHCGKNYRHDTRLAHCAHVHSRNHRATRWHPLGAVCLCASCHRRFTDFPIEWDQAVRNILGVDNRDEVSRLAHGIRKYTKAEKQEMLEHYKAELEVLKQRRLEGEDGYLSFMGYD